MIARNWVAAGQNLRPLGDMRLALLIALTMTAFAANSLLNRVAVDGGYIDPAGFAVIRVASGAVVLMALARIQARQLSFATRRRFIGATALTVYMVGFSIAYLTLDAGLGALILFGAVQISMFVITGVMGAGPSARQIAGAAIAFGGLIVVLNPTHATGTDLLGTLLMVAAGVGWGVYTLVGKSEPDALAGTAANFALALVPTAIFPLMAGMAMFVTVPGIALAVVSGAITSGLGYALWYAILPRINAVLAAILMLSVPVLAVLGGVALLGEEVGVRFLFGALLVLGGISLSIRKPA